MRRFVSRAGELARPAGDIACWEERNMALQGWNWRGDGGSREPGEEEWTSGIMAFTPAESKRLIARAVVAMEPVRAALAKGKVVVAGGTTTAYVAEEILGRPVAREFYIKGNITHGFLCTTRRSDNWIKPYGFVDGRPIEGDAMELLKEFDDGDVFIKSANAVDPQGNVGILLGSPVGGTIAAALGIVAARGSHLIVPVGLEKLVSSVAEASTKCGIKRLRYPDGGTVGFMPVMGATVVTEIRALGILADVKATHVASGGVGGSEGAVVLVVEGPDPRVRAAFELWESIKGEPATPPSPIAARYGIDMRSGG